MEAEPKRVIDKRDGQWWACNRSSTVLTNQYQTVIESLRKVDEMKAEPRSAPVENFLHLGNKGHMGTTRKVYRMFQ
jgi:hypothetical protein